MAVAVAVSRCEWSGASGQAQHSTTACFPLAAMQQSMPPPFPPARVSPAARRPCGTAPLQRGPCRRCPAGPPSLCPPRGAPAREYKNIVIILWLWLRFQCFCHEASLTVSTTWGTCARGQAAAASSSSTAAAAAAAAAVACVASESTHACMHAQAPARHIAGPPHPAPPKPLRQPCSKNPTAAPPPHLAPCARLFRRAVMTARGWLAASTRPAALHTPPRALSAQHPPAAPQTPAGTSAPPPASPPS